MLQLYFKQLKNNRKNLEANNPVKQKNEKSVSHHISNKLANIFIPHRRKGTDSQTVQNPQDFRLHRVQEHMHVSFYVSITLILFGKPVKIENKVHLPTPVSCLVMGESTKSYPFLVQCKDGLWLLVNFWISLG